MPVTDTHTYRISVSGGLGAAAREGFEGLAIDTLEGVTELTGDIDQAGLFGVLQRIQVLGLELVEVHRLSS